MRPLAIQESYLLAPLNQVLGTQANVRILRILTQQEGPKGISELAREAAITVRGARQALKALVDLGVVEAVGTMTRGQHVQMSRSWPFADALAKLFAAEVTRVDDLWNNLRKLCGRLVPPPFSVWLEGPVTTQNDGPGDSLTLVALANTKQANRLWDPLIESVEAIESAFKVLLDLRVMTHADLAVLNEERQKTLVRGKVLFGVEPGVFLRMAQGVPPQRSHGTGTQIQADEKLKVKGEQIAQALAHDPRIIVAALAWIEKRLPDASAGEVLELQEWRRILTYGTRAQIRRVLTDPGERSTRLRQTLPFQYPMRHESDDGGSKT